MKARGIWAEAAKADVFRCYNWIEADADGRRIVKPGGFCIPSIQALIARWREGERLAEESLAALFELIVERGDPVPGVMREFALLRIRGERLGKAKKSPWENAERDSRIWHRIDEVMRANPGIAMYPTRARKGGGTSAVEIVAQEIGMDPGAVEAVWRKITNPGYLDRAPDR